MDLALQSGHTQISLYFHGTFFPLEFFEHKLLQKINDLGLRIDENYHSISIPVINLSSSIRSLKLESGVDLLRSMNLSGVDSVCFVSTSKGLDRMTFAPLNQITELELKSVTFMDRECHLLPSLTTLKLQDVRFIGPMRTYIRCPQLNSLEYHLSYDKFFNYMDSQNPYKIPTQKILDLEFFQQTPNLESISLSGARLEAPLISSLQSCPALHSLVVDDCHMQLFIPRFLDSLNDADHFPSLTMIHIDNSWPARSRWEYAEFTQKCRLKRASIYFSGNGAREKFQLPTHQDVYRNMDIPSWLFGDIDQIQDIIRG
ncbi:hypothetical protein CPB86DRAFT_781145 [Serendipita vermifera]|nr:hypothetical protein CPB86DRAFT_781145 [Serendipita vermifera]